MMLKNRLPALIAISGRGSHLRNFIHLCATKRLDLDIQGVLCNNPAATGLIYAQQARIPTHVIDHRQFTQREYFEQELTRIIESYKPQLIILAGFMRILSPAFVQQYLGKLINIHPSLLPAFPGLHCHRRALAAGVKEHGATVHFVTPEIDQGPLIARIKLSVEAAESEHSLAERVLILEHLLYPQVISWIIQGQLSYANQYAEFKNERLPVCYVKQ